jgi:hypothetical protein
LVDKAEFNFDDGDDDHSDYDNDGNYKKHLWVRKWVSGKEWMEKQGR